MQSTDWAQAFSIVGGGLTAVFIIMSLLALATHFMGKIFINLEKRKAAEAKAAEEAKS